VTRHRTLLGVAIAAALGVACAEVGTAPDVPAAIELPPFAFPSVVVGDTLRNEAGIATPIRAIVRNSAGEIITDATPTYIYADFARDGAFLIDSTSGIVVGAKVVSEGRIAARIGSSLQVLRTLIGTVAPDTAFAGTAPASLILTLPDTGRARAQSNTTQELPLRVRNRASTTAVDVQGWLVRFQVLRPVNLTNDTTQAAYLVDDQGRASTLDTTSASGQAGRRVRVRGALFPVAQGAARVTDTVVVQATLTYKGKPVPGSPLRLSAVVIRPASQ
jgi:hypothetical protein